MSIPELSTPFQQAVQAELSRARSKHAPPIHSAHEGFAVILEEVDELKMSIWTDQHKRTPQHTLEELVQVAAMCQRMAEDLGLILEAMP